MKNIYKFYKDISYIYNRFILERYLFKFNYKKKVIIKIKRKCIKIEYIYLIIMVN